MEHAGARTVHASPSGERLTIEALAARSGTTRERIEDLVRRRVLTSAADDSFVEGDVHRVRLVDAFEEAGIPLEALVAATDRGRVTFAYYPELHQPAGRPSDRSYDEFRSALPPAGISLEQLFAAFGLAEPAGSSHLAIEDERFIATLVEALDAVGQPDLAARLVRVFGESLRRASEATLDVYAEAATKHEPMAPLPLEEQYERLFVPWARLARMIPALASWLAAQHLSRVIDASSVNSTEAILEEERLIEHRTGPEPAIAFFDLTGFTTFAERRGDEAAAAMALRLADVAREISTRHGGRVVKLLGDGVLLRFADSASAVRALLDLLEAAEENGLPPGHAGIHQGPVITRNGDVFGRTVNLAARVGDAAPSGRLHVTAAVAAALDGLDGAAYDVAAAGTEALQGIGFVETFRVTRAR